MFIQVLILAVVAATQATYLHGGKSFSSRKDDGYGNYIFSYDIEDPLGATNGRYEIGDAHGNKKGGYTITDIDGRARRVEYVADEHGFRAVVHTNEPGTAPSHPASAPYIVDRPLVHDTPVSAVKGVAHPVAIAPVSPVGKGSVKRVVRPVLIDHVPQTVNQVPITAVRKVVRPVGHISQTVHQVPIESVKTVARPVAVDHISQTVHDVSAGKGSHPVFVDHVSQEVHDVPVGAFKETLRPVHISQSVHSPRKIFATESHRVGPIVSRARTFREAQMAHAASLRPNLYNGQYDVKYVQPAPPVVTRFRPAKFHGPTLRQYSAAANGYPLQLIDNALDVPVHASPPAHVKGSPFHQGGLFRHVYGTSLGESSSFRSHLL